MATLCIGNIDCSAPLLRDWIGSDWTMVFSHPTDFQDSGTEQDRWLAILRDEFRARSVRPIACSRTAGDADNSWVSRLTQDHRLVRLHVATEDSDDIADQAARVLRDEIAQLDSHFALIVDPLMKSRGVLRYNAGRTSVSPLDLLGSIDALRHRVAVRQIGRSRGEVRAVA